MPIVCPTVLASTADEYQAQISKIASFAKRIQIDLTDGEFAPSKTVPPAAAWWPAGVQADVHLMYRYPLRVVKSMLLHSPNMIIIHAEAADEFTEIYNKCRNASVKLGMAILPETQPQKITEYLSRLDHVLIFSGSLGKFGGRADLALLEKAAFLKNKRPDLEIGWDGGVNMSNVSELVFGGVDVLNVGGFIQKADDPERAYNNLFRIASETGTT